MNVDLPADVVAAVKATETTRNEEELAVISLYTLLGGAPIIQEESELQRVFDRLETTTSNDHALFCDLEWSKKQGNAAFAVGDWMTALQYYTSILKSLLRDDRRDSYRSVLPDSVAELLVTIHANTAQTLLNLARNEEAAKQCQDALKMPILFDNASLHQKVIHRLEACQKPPTLAARLAAEEAAKIPMPIVQVTDEKVDFVAHHSGLLRNDDSKREHSPQEVAKYALQLSEGDSSLAIVWIGSCMDEHGNEFESTVRLIRGFALDHGISRRITNEEVERLYELVGRGPALRKRRKKRAAALERGQSMLEDVVVKCENTVWAECFTENAALTSTVLAQPREWLRTRDTKMAISYFLAAADEVAQVDSEKVSPNTRKVYAGKGGVMDLRATVELTWLDYVQALTVLDEGKYGTESQKAKWDDVKFERMRHIMRMARGMLEPPEQAEVGFEKEVASATTETKVGDNKTADESPPSAVAKAHVPSLADYSGFTIKRQAELEATKRGLRKLREAIQEATGEDGEISYGFGPCRWAVNQTFARSKSRIIEQSNNSDGELSIVDHVWHVCIHKSQGMRPEMMELMPVSDTAKYRPACIFVANKAVPTPPYETSSFADMARMMGGYDAQVLPKSTFATVWFTDEMHEDQKTMDLIFKVLFKAVETRGGRPNRIAFGPVGTMKLRRPYLDFGDGGPAPDVSSDQIDIDNYHDSSTLSRSQVEAFVEDNLGVKEQWLEGWWGEMPEYRSHEERPKKQSPAQYRAEYIEERKSS